MFKAYSQFLTEIISNLATDPNNVPLPFNQNHNKQVNWFYCALCPLFKIISVNV